MKVVDLYARVRRACPVEGMSQRQAAQFAVRMHGHQSTLDNVKQRTFSCGAKQGVSAQTGGGLRSAKPRWCQ